MSTPHPPNPTPLSAGAWEERYQQGTTRWNLGQPAPPFVTLLNSSDPPQPGRMAVLGAGHGHDALLFAEHGFEVVGFDFAPSAIEAATAAAQTRQLSAQFLPRDIFKLAEEFAHDFDYVLEHTCYCAILPEQRADYVQVVRSILRPQGELIALFWAHDRPDGPPFGTTPDEILQRFTPDFHVISIAQPINSVEMRKDEEYLIRFQLKQ